MHATNDFLCTSMPQQRGIAISISAAFLPSEQDRRVKMILLRVFAATVSGAKDDPGQTTLRALPHHCAIGPRTHQGDSNIYPHSFVVSGRRVAARRGRLLKY